MFHRAVAWPYDVAYVCAKGLRELIAISFGELEFHDRVILNIIAPVRREVGLVPDFWLFLCCPHGIFRR